MTHERYHESQNASSRENRPATSWSKWTLGTRVNETGAVKTFTRDDRVPEGTSKARTFDWEKATNYRGLFGRLVGMFFALLLAVFIFESSALANTYTVTSTQDTNGQTCGGTCTLRQAINAANANPGADVINFNIAGSGVHTITPTTLLPHISGTVTIDGYTQSGSSQNTQQIGSNAVLAIELSGANISAPPGTGGFGLIIEAPTCVIRGLIVNRFPDAGIRLEDQGAVVSGCFLGTDASGTSARPNGVGVSLYAASGNLIGGAFVSSRNLISGNKYIGIQIQNATSVDNAIFCNLIGTEKSGTGQLANKYGIWLIDAGKATIGSGVSAATNVISGNTDYGLILSSSSLNVIVGNFIGTDTLGTSKVGNGDGVLIGGNSHHNHIGQSGAGNVISGNTKNGLVLGQDTNNNQIYGNFIGTGKNGTSALGNTENGIYMVENAANNHVGGSGAGEGNVIAFNNDGVFSAAGTGNGIFNNSIFSNARLGINLDQAGTVVNPNDVNDGDAGPNNLQNYPVITSAVTNGNTVINGTLNSDQVGANYWIQLFVSPQCSASGYGEGKTFIGVKQIFSSSNDSSFSAAFPALNIGDFVTATVFDQYGNTSEFSQCRQITPPLPVGSLVFSTPAYTVNEGVGTATITVNRSNGSAGLVTINYAATNGSATAGADYVAVSGVLQFGSGVTTQTFNVPITNDVVYEDNESVNLTLSNPTGGASLGNPGTATLTITDNDNPPSLSINDVSVGEGNSGTTPASFTVTLTGATSKTTTVTYATVAGGTATPGSDYQAANGTLTFAAGEVSKPVTIIVNGDVQQEPNETFLVQLANPTNASLTKAQGVGTITNDDAPPAPGTIQFSAALFSVNESGAQATITAKRVGGSNGAVSVQYATVAGGTAIAALDYAAASGSLNWADGDAADKTFLVAIVDDSINEPDEVLNLALTNPGGGAALGNPSTATVTIVDNDPQPNVSINDLSLAEGNSGMTSFVFSVTLSAASGQIVTINYLTADASAKAGSDYQTVSGQLTFNPGEISKTFSVPVNGDTQNEPDETFTVNLTNPGQAAIQKGIAFGTIINDDAPQSAGTLQFSAATYSANESSGQATITVKRLGGGNGAVSVQYATIGGGTATVGADYTSTSGTLSWGDGDTADKSFSVGIADDLLDEPDETVSLSLSNPAGGAALGSASAVLTIIDNDEAPTPTPTPSLSINDVSLAEGNGGTSDFTFNVVLSSQSSEVVTVNYATADVTAVAGSDYQANNGLLIFNPGETSKTVTVLVNGDTQVEPSESFLVNLSNPTNATLAKSQGTGSIVNDDNVQPPQLQFNQSSYAVSEDLAALTVTVTRTGDSSGTATVDYGTVDGSATQKGDFEYASGRLTFAPGETSKTFQVLINEDMYTDGNESFSVQLSNSSGASLGQQSTTQVNITDDSPESPSNPIDQAQSFVHTHYHDFLNREPDAAGLQFWTNEILSCGGDQQCIETKRINVSAAYFLSIEFQQTGFLLHLMEKESYGKLPKYAAFMRDLRAVGDGVVVNAPGWQQKLAANQQQLAEDWVNRPEFKTKYDAMTNTDYVNALYANAGVPAQQSEKTALVTKLDTASATRASVLLDVTQNASFRQQEQNPSFVLMQYFGYLRRDPDAAPDSDLSGYNFWLNKLTSFGGDYQKAEMVKAFLISLEYRSRFGQ